MTTQAAGRPETEYLSSDSDTKATKPSSSRHNSRVNGQSRTYSAPRSRSRSPYRASRGEKRVREDDHRPPRHDLRTFKVKYEDERRSRYHPHEDRKSKRQRTCSSSRSRSRSRSPFRHKKEEDHPSTGDTKTTQSVSTQDQDSDGVPRLEISAKVVEQNEEQAVSEGTKQRFAAFHSRIARTNVCCSHNLEPSPILTDEAAMIEARRKRREAIKNQYRSQATPLLVQALHLGPNTPGDSVTTTPNRSSKYQTMRTDAL